MLSLLASTCWVCPYPYPHDGWEEPLLTAVLNDFFPDFLGLIGAQPGTDWFGETIAYCVNTGP